MRILLDQVAHDMRNKGNNALLQAAIDRLSYYWPEAKFDLITVAPSLAKLYFPTIQPVDPRDLRPIRRRIDNYGKLIPASVWQLIFELREEYFHRRAVTERSQIQREIDSDHMDNLSKSSQNNDQFKTNVNSLSGDHIGRVDVRDRIADYDLVVASGGGYMCDNDRLVLAMFDRFKAAIDRGVPTVITGVGVGPMEDPELISKAMVVLPKVDLILFRNRRLGLPLLDSLGVPADRRMITGDDAIELTYKARRSSIGSNLGVSIRVSSYTQLQINQLDILRLVLQNVALKYNARLVAVPISSAPHESDITHIRYILDGYNQVSIGWKKLSDHNDSIKKAGHCRVMVTGTYHGAIFSLAQGIPVVGVAKSKEYFNKLSELSDEFGSGCSVISLDDDLLENNLTTAIENAWISAEELRPSLLEASTRLIDLQHEGYRRIFELVDG